MASNECDVDGADGLAASIFRALNWGNARGDTESEQRDGDEHGADDDDERNGAHSAADETLTADDNDVTPVTAESADEPACGQVPQCAHVTATTDSHCDTGATVPVETTFDVTVHTGATGDDRASLAPGQLHLPRIVCDDGGGANAVASCTTPTGAVETTFGAVSPQHNTSASEHSDSKRSSVCSAERIAVDNDGFKVPQRRRVAAAASTGASGKMPSPAASSVIAAPVHHSTSCDTLQLSGRSDAVGQALSRLTSARHSFIYASADASTLRADPHRASRARLPSRPTALLLPPATPTSVASDSQLADDNISIGYAPLNDEERQWHGAACRCDYGQLAATLLAAPDVVNAAARPNGYTALHWAAAAGRVDCVQLLAGAYQANVNATSYGGYTPLHLACMKGRTDVVKLLVDTYGADRQALDHSGRRPESYSNNALLTRRRRPVAGARRTGDANAMDARKLSTQHYCPSPLFYSNYRDTAGSAAPSGRSRSPRPADSRHYFPFV